MDDGAMIAFFGASWATANFRTRRPSFSPGGSDGKKESKPAMAIQLITRDGFRGQRAATCVLFHLLQHVAISTRKP